MQHPRHARTGMTVGEAVTLVLVFGVLAVLLLPILSGPQTSGPHPGMCRRHIGRLFKSMRLYLNNYGEFYPLAWHEGSGGGFGQVAYGRLLVHMASDTYLDFSKAKNDAAKVSMLEETVRSWSDPRPGLTNDYFSPPVTFRLPAPDEMTKPYSKHTQYTWLTARVAPSEMPFLADAAASTPQPDAEDVPPETRTGIPGGFKRDWLTVGGKSYHAFYGIARSWVGWDPATGAGTGPQRFDFRHRGAVNVIFLDGHVDTIKQTDTARLRAVHEAWNVDSEGAP